MLIKLISLKMDFNCISHFKIKNSYIVNHHKNVFTLYALYYLPCVSPLVKLQRFAIFHATSTTQNDVKSYLALGQMYLYVY